MHVYVLLLTGVLAGPAAAQEKPIPVELANRTMTVSPNGSPITAKSAAYCRSVPRLRSKPNASDPRVARMIAACRMAGYRY